LRLDALWARPIPIDQRIIVPVVTFNVEGQPAHNKRAMAHVRYRRLAPFMTTADAIIVVFQEIPLDCYARGGELSFDRPDIQEKVSKGCRSVAMGCRSVAIRAQLDLDPAQSESGQGLAPAPLTTERPHNP